MLCPMFEKCSGEIKSKDKCQISKKNLFSCFKDTEEPGAKVDPTSDACRKCPWKEPAITLAGASWRLRQWYQCCADEEEGQVEHLRDLAKWACDKIRDLQALDKKA